jgi:hypothetical protein
MRTKRMSTADLLTRWRSLIAEKSPAKQEVDSQHPLRLLFGMDDASRPLFAVMSRTMPTEPDLPEDVIETRITVRDDGLYLLQMCLREPSLFEVFAQLCGDLAARSRAARTEGAALHDVYVALAEWKRLLRLHAQHMSLESLRGLIGELWYGYRELVCTRSVTEVFSRWCGPYGAHQDYQFPDGVLFEVKTVRPGGDSVEIASEYQLEPYGHRLMLAVVELDDSDASVGDAVSLPQILARIRDDLAGAPIALDSFETALHEFRDPFTHKFYAEHWFQVRSCRLHEVMLLWVVKRR